MKIQLIFVLILVSLGFSPVFAQDNEFGEELFEEEASPSGDASFDESGTDFDAGGDVDFGDFDEGNQAKKPNTPTAPAPSPESPEANPEDISLDPLNEDSEKTTDIPVKPDAPRAPEAPAPVPIPEASPSYAEPIAVDDEPDMRLETRLHDIYVNFHAAKTSDEQWAALIGDRESEAYQIQNGDTLWGVSKTLFNDGNYWPKIWSLNSRITNPHLISTGNTIRFLLGSEAEPPAFTVTEKGDQGEPAEQGDSNIGDDKNSGQVTEIQTGTGVTVEIPPPLEETRPVLRKLPPSLPQWQNNNQTGKYDDMGIDYGRRPDPHINKLSYLLSYIEDQKIEYLGEIVEIEAGAAVASDDQYVYVKLPQGTGQVGQKYLVVQDMGPIQAPNKTITDSSLGHRVDIQGELKLVDVVLAKVGPGNETWRCQVTKAIHPVGLKAGVVSGELVRYKFDTEGPRSNVVAQVVGGPYDNKRTLFAAQSILFLSRGSSDGLAEGQVLPVRSNQVLRNPNTIIEENVRPIGYVKILRTSGHFSTAVVIKSFEDIFAGDLTGQGSLLSRAGAVEEENALGIEPLPGEDVPMEEINEFDDPEIE